MPWTSPNFAFLEDRDPLLHRYASLAERYFADDANGSIVKMRQFAEALAHAVAAGFGNPASTEDEFVAVLRNFDWRVPPRVVDLLHDLRKLGNRAAHAHGDDHRDALTALKVGHQVAVWYFAIFRSKGFKAPPFVIPPNPAEATSALSRELEEMRDEAARQAAELASLHTSTSELHRLRAEAEDRATRAFADRDAALDLAVETEQALAEECGRLEAEVASARGEFRYALPVADEPASKVADIASGAQVAHLVEPDDVALSDVVIAARAAADAIDLDEATTRKLIDDQLRRAGWEADTQELHWSLGTRPQRGRAIAIAEVPTASGPVDYVLFKGLVAVAVVEAKRGSVDVSSVLQHQAHRYARDLAPALVGDHGPWGEYRVPFAFATNGRPYLDQIKTKSGVWFRDLRADTNLSRALMGWWTPDGIAHALGMDAAASEAALEAEPFDDLGLYDFQIEVVRKVEAAIAEGRRSMLVAMATGTGKTRTSLGRDIGSAKLPFEPGDVLYGKLRPYLRKTFVATRPGVAVTDLVPLRAKDGIEAAFLKHFLLSPLHSDYIAPLMKGIGMPRLGVNDLQAMPLPLPPANEQQRIVARLDALQARSRAAREALAEVPALLDLFRQSVLAAAFRGDLTAEWRAKNPDVEPASNLLERIRAERRRRWEEANPRKKYVEPEAVDPTAERMPELPEGWGWARLEEVATDFDYGTAAKSAGTGRFPVLRMGNLQGGEIDWTDLKYTDDPAEIEKYALEPNTVLFNRTNSPELVGKTAIYRGERPAVFAGYLVRVALLDSVDPDLVNLHLNSLRGREPKKGTAP